ncbi:UNVERIFIED_CONTAM: hypothetical protein DES50_101279 [Williamsia faeni]
MTPQEPRHLLRRAELVPAGALNDQAVRTGLRSGALIRRCAGVYVPPDPDLSATAEYLERVYARAGKSKVRVISHRSAAAVHDLPLLRPDDTKVHFIVRWGGRVAAGIHLHEAEVDRGDVVMVNGHRVTSVVRTVVDVAREGDFIDALAILDSGLRAGVQRADVEAMAQRFHGFVGGSTLRDAAQAADGQAANPGESLSRGLMLGFPEVPAPRLQHPFVDDDGLIGFTDFDWDGRVVGEFDGRYKYRKHLRPGESVEDAVIREKYREDRLRALGIHVMRWTWSDLMNPQRFRALLDRGLQLGGVL